MAAHTRKATPGSLASPRPVGKPQYAFASGRGLGAGLRSSNYAFAECSVPTRTSQHGSIASCSRWAVNLARQAVRRSICTHGLRPLEPFADSHLLQHL